MCLSVHVRERESKRGGVSLLLRLQRKGERKRERALESKIKEKDGLSIALE